MVLYITVYSLYTLFCLLFLSHVHLLCIFHYRLMYKVEQSLLLCVCSETISSLKRTNSKLPSILVQLFHLSLLKCEIDFYEMFFEFANFYCRICYH
jgi:hypothetical protein